MELKFRNLEPHEIDCKPTIIGTKIEISLHCKAATCTKLLNETVGPMGWEKEYTNGNKNCIVRIWDNEKNRMISKEDCGGSLTEIDGYKGQASNGFKRVCALGWGLGIELYSQPSILLTKTDDNTTFDEKGNPIVSERYSVKSIEYKKNADGTEEKEIVRCVIVDSNGTVVYDGPDENGNSRISEIVSSDNDEVMPTIPEDADMINSEEYSDDEDEAKTAVVETAHDVVKDEDNELPDNTDGFDDFNDNECDTQPMPFGTTDYRREFEKEIHRTHVKKDDVLKVLKIESFDAIDSVDEATLEATLKRLRALNTYTK